MWTTATAAEQLKIEVVLLLVMSRQLQVQADRSLRVESKLPAADSGLLQWRWKVESEDNTVEE